MVLAKNLVHSLILSTLVLTIVASPGNPTFASDCITPGCNQGKFASPKRINGRIKYTIKNTAPYRIYFQLPSGMDYSLGPGQRGSYRNTGNPNAFRIYIYNTQQAYRLRTGNHVLWKNANGALQFNRDLPIN